MSDFAKYDPEPICTIILTASATEAYLTRACSRGIPELTEEPWGYDKSCITRNSPGCFLGCRPNGDITASGKGERSKGPINLD